MKAVRLTEVTRELEDPKIWDDPKRAQELGKERKALEGVVGTLTTLDAGLHDSSELFELARADADDATLEAVALDVAASEKIAADLEFRRQVVESTRVTDTQQSVAQPERGLPQRRPLV